MFYFSYAFTAIKIHIKCVCFQIFLFYCTYRSLAVMVPWQCYARETGVLMFHCCFEGLIFTNILGHFPARGVTSCQGTICWKKPFQSRLTLRRSHSLKSYMQYSVRGPQIKQPVSTTKNNPLTINPYPTAFPYGNGMVLHFYQQQESSTTKTVHKVINKGLKTYV